MAKSISEEELQLRKRARRRLVGAIALVTIVAVFLPMVLDHEPRPLSQDVSIRIPSPNSGDFTSKIVPVVPSAPGLKPVPEVMPAVEAPAPKAAATPALPDPNDTEAAPPKKVLSQKPPSPPKQADKPKAADAPKVAEKPQAAEKIEPGTKGVTGYVVQVAALSDADKAKQMREQIAAAGVKAYTEVVPTAKGNVTRVRAGPFAAREDAEKARDKLKSLGLNGNIVPK